MTAVAVPDIASVITVTVPTTSPHLRRGEQLFAKHHVALRRHVRRRDPSLADDVVSETFAIAWRRLDEIPADREFPWLCVTADNVLRNQWRGQRRAHALTEALEWVTPGTEAPVDVPVVGEALRDLPERERALLTMTSFEGLSAVEAADRLGIAHGTARNALVNARRQLATRLAALGVVVASIVFAIVFAAGRPSDGEQAQQVVADSMRKAEGVRGVATIVGSDGRRRAYEIQTDAKTGEQHVTLPDGRTARTDGEELTVVPRRGESPKDTREVQRRYADDLSVLEVATPEQIAELIASARRAGSAPVGPAVDGRATTVVRGTITDPAGRRREVELLITVDEPEVVRMRTRLAEPGAQWVTVDFSDWEAVSRRSLAAAQQAAPVERSDAAALKPSPLERAGGDADVASIADAGPSTPGGAAADVDPDAGDAPSKPLPKEPTAPRLPAAYDGPTGAVLHWKTARMITGGIDQFTEAWIELGGGERARTVVTGRTGRGGDSTSTTWATRDLVLHTFGGVTKTDPDLTLLCKPTTPTEVKTAKSLVEAVDVAKAALANGQTYPAGQPWGGPAAADGTLPATQPTVTLQSPSFDGTTNIQQLTMIAATGQIVQKELVGPDLKGPIPPEIYETWEVLPAGGAATDLIEPVPDEAGIIPCGT